MKLNTRLFGEIEVAEEKIITFPNGIIGFPEMNQFTLIYDEEQGTGAGIRWLQSLDEPNFAMPVMDPLVVKEDYNPDIEDELLANIGEVTGDNLLVLVTVTVPSDLTKMSVNLQGPIIINVDERKACQMIVDAEAYPVKYPIYDILRARKAGV
ncbi:MAG: flagellar assembly protein FliW [Lachnospiraceae bacterium]|nr:flagellar assembly protein FliW [Lachnospiraceae bacterium]